MDKRRIWEIDLLRAIAIILMVVFHTVYDLDQFMGYEINTLSGFWYWEGKLSAIIFIFLAGISSGLSSNSAKRGIKVLASGMVITLVSFIFFREQYIRFGILHLLGTGMIIYPLLKRMNNIILLISAAGISLAAVLINGILSDTVLLIPIGIMYRGFVSIDYYPIVPYIAVFILGVLAYRIYYHKGISLIKFSYENKHVLFLSRNSLLIYLIHQPLILLLLYTVRYFITRR